MGRGAVNQALACRALPADRAAMPPALSTWLPPRYLRLVKRSTFADGDVIFREGEASDAAYLVVTGFVEIVTGHGSPRQTTIGRLGKGQYFGEMGAIDDSPRSATAVAQGEVDC